MNFIRKNAPPATAAALRAHASELRTVKEAKQREHDELSAALPNYVADREAFAEVRARLSSLATSIQSDQDAIALIEAQIPAAEQREAREALEAQIAQQAKKTAKLKRDVRSRYNKAAEAFAAVLAEIKSDNDAWRHLNLLASLPEYRGVRRGQNAERSLQLESGNSWAGSVTDDLVVRNFDGRILFK